MANALKISEIRHPLYMSNFNDWQLWRDTFEGGTYYLDTYLQKFSDRETTAEFNIRKSYTPIPTFAKSALIDVRNSIFQRLTDVIRVGGSDSYKKSVAGENGGVDRKGSSMNSFMGIDVLTELLIMGRCGIFVDNTAPTSVTFQQTLADANSASPYCYYYPIESILSYTEQPPEEPGQFKAILLQDCFTESAPNITGIDLPSGQKKRYRLLWIGEDGYVYYRLYDNNEQPIFQLLSDETGAVRLNIREIPFHVADIGDSVLKDTASYQKALLNLGSGDVNYAIKSNTPFLTIQAELRTVGAHLKVTGEDATPGGQFAADREERIGAGVGRYYDRETDRPEFIAPPTEPLKASMALQERLEDNIRRLINLAIENKIGSRTESAESKKMSSQGLEAGLSYIGLVLQETEQQVAKFFAAYENSVSPDSATVSYPSRYILKTDEERLKDAEAADKLAQTIPSRTARKCSKKNLALALFSSESVETLIEIEREIETSPVADARPEAIVAHHGANMVSDATASEALGYEPGEAEQASKDAAERTKAIVEAQASVKDATGMEKPGARSSSLKSIDPVKTSAQSEKK